MAIFDNLGGGSKPNVFYTDETDKVQIRTKDGNVHNWKDGNLKNLYLFKDGVVNTEIVGNFSANNYKRDTGNGTGAPTLTIGTTTMTYVSTAAEGSGYAINPLDLTNKEKIVIVFRTISGTSSSKNLNVGFISEFANRYTFARSISITTTGSNVQYEINISDITGLYYLMFNFVGSGITAEIEQIYLL